MKTAYFFHCDSVSYFSKTNARLTVMLLPLYSRHVLFCDCKLQLFSVEETSLQPETVYLSFPSFSDDILVIVELISERRCTLSGTLPHVLDVQLLLMQLIL